MNFTLKASLALAFLLISHSFACNTVAKNVSSSICYGMLGNSFCLILRLIFIAERWVSTGVFVSNFEASMEAPTLFLPLPPISLHWSDPSYTSSDISLWLYSFPDYYNTDVLVISTNASRDAMVFALIASGAAGNYTFLLQNDVTCEASFVTILISAPSNYLLVPCVISLAVLLCGFVVHYCEPRILFCFHAASQSSIKWRHVRRALKLDAVAVQRLYGWGAVLYSSFLRDGILMLLPAALWGIALCVANAVIGHGLSSDIESLTYRNGTFDQRALTWANAAFYMFCFASVCGWAGLITVRRLRMSRSGVAAAPTASDGAIAAMPEDPITTFHLSRIPRAWSPDALHQYFEAAYAEVFVCLHYICPKDAAETACAFLTLNALHRRRASARQ